jgi:hypothetical protein
MFPSIYYYSFLNYACQKGECGFNPDQCWIIGRICRNNLEIHSYLLSRIFYRQEAWALKGFGLEMTAYIFLACSNASPLLRLIDHRHQTHVQNGHLFLLYPWPALRFLWNIIFMQEL